MLDPHRRLRRHDGLRMVCDPQPSRPDHRQVICPIADGQRVRRRQPARRRKFVQRRQLGIPVQDRLAHSPQQRRAVVQQGVGAVVVEPQQRRDPAGEVGEPARHQRRRGAMRPHRRHQFPRTRHQVRGGPGLLQCRQRQPAQQADAVAESARKVDLPVHAAPGDGRHLLAQPGIGGQLVQRLGRHDGAVHVRHQQPLAPVGSGRQHGIDRRGVQRGVYGVGVRHGGAGDVGGLALGQHGRRTALHGLPHPGDQGGRQGAGALRGDQR